MKRFALLLIAALALACLPARAASTRTYATISVTNTPVNGDFLVVQGSTRTWYNTVTNVDLEISVTNSIVSARTNLAQHLVAYPPSGGYAVYYGTGTNDVVIAAPVDTVLTVTLATNWGVITYATNTVQTSYTLVLPFTNQTNTWRTNMMTHLTTNLSLYSTVALDQDATVASELVGLANVQTVAGVKTFSGGLVSTNTHWLAFESETSGAGTNGIIFNKAAASSSTNEYYLIRGDSFGWPTIVYQNGGLSPTDLPDEIGGILTYAMAKAYFPLLGDSAHLNQWVSSNEFSGVLITNLNLISGTATNLTIQAGDLSGNVTLITNGTWTGGTAVNLTVSSGDLSGDVTLLTGGTWTNGTMLDATLTGQATVSTNLSLTANTHSSLANGNNAGVVLPTAFTRITVGPTAAFAICGITGGNDGRLVVLYNTTAENMTIANDSGVDATATNRIYTLTGSDYATTGTGAVTLIYDGTAQRWILVNARD